MILQKNVRIYQKDIAEVDRIIEIQRINYGWLVHQISITWNWTSTGEVGLGLIVFQKEGSDESVPVKST